MDIITLWRTRFSNRSLLVDFAPTDEKPIVYSTLFNEWLKFIDSGVSGSSITNVKDSIAFFTKNEDFIGQLIANDILAQVYDQLGIYKEALTHIHNALSLDNIDNNLPELGDLYATAGNIQLRLEDFDGAFKHYETSLAIRDHNNDSYAKASVLNLMSRLKAEQGDYKGSEEFYKKTIELRISLNDSALP
jgi:tetratricopeptide (TPR) repeat protein